MILGVDNWLLVWKFCPTLLLHCLSRRNTYFKIRWKEKSGIYIIGRRVSPLFPLPGLDFSAPSFWLPDVLVVCLLTVSPSRIYKLQERGLVLPTALSQALEQQLAHSRQSTNICWVKEWGSSFLKAHSWGTLMHWGEYMFPGHPWMSLVGKGGWHTAQKYLHFFRG